MAAVRDPILVFFSLIVFLRIVQVARVLALRIILIFV